MAELAIQRPELYIKLGSATMAFQLSILKLQKYRFDVAEDVQKDFEFAQELKNAYSEFSSQDELYSERFFASSEEAYHEFMEWLDEHNSNEPRPPKE